MSDPREAGHGVVPSAQPGIGSGSRGPAPAAPGVDYILETEGLTKEFRGFFAVNGVDLRVRRGTIHALIGPNGAGKTTCFNLLTHFLAPTRGRIRYNGRDITGSRPADIARLGLVRSFQISAVFPHLTVIENVRVALQRRRGRSFDFWRSEKVLAALDDRAFGLALIIQGLFRNQFGSSGLPYRIPDALTGAHNLGFMTLPNYRAWVIVFSLAVCLGTWWMVERTKLGAYLRAATENPTLVRAFGINVPRMIALTYGFGVGLAALAGVLAAPIYQVNPLMGADLIIVVFAVVVIGGMGSIMGSIVTGFGLGVVEGLTKVFYPEASNTVIFVIMAIVLLVKPAGLFGRAQ